MRKGWIHEVVQNLDLDKHRCTVPDRPLKKSYNQRQCPALHALPSGAEGLQPGWGLRKYCSSGGRVFPGCLSFLQPWDFLGLVV